MENDIIAMPNVLAIRGMTVTLTSAVSVIHLVLMDVSMDIHATILVPSKIHSAIYVAILNVFLARPTQPVIQIPVVITPPTLAQYVNVTAIVASTVTKTQDSVYSSVPMELLYNLPHVNVILVTPTEKMEFVTEFLALKAVNSVVVWKEITRPNV